MGNAYCYELGDINTDEQVILRTTLEKVIIYIYIKKCVVQDRFRSISVRPSTSVYGPVTQGTDYQLRIGSIGSGY